MQVKLAATLVLGLAAVAPTARADVDTSEAQTLFEDGRTLLEAGKTDAACEKFELSIAKDPRAVGTLLNLGLCNERRGKVATALKLFQEAFDRAGEQQLEQHKEAAQDHITKLVPQVPVLVVKVASPIAGQSLFVDDVVIKDPTHELQLDPGPHRLVATAPGRLPFEKSFPIHAEERISLDVPMLELPKVVVDGGSSRRLVGKIATVSGAGLAVAATGMLVYAYRKYHRQFDDGNCQTIDDRRLCNDDGQNATQLARNVATGGSIIGIVGAVSLAAGIIVWTTAPAERSRATVIAGPGSVALSVRF